MEYRYMGATGLKVSALCLGAMTFGREATEAISVQMMNRFVELGANFIDTADVYSLGLSEEIVGRWLKTQKRDDLVIATKARFSMGDGPNDVGVSRKHLMSAVEASLRRLDTDYIDLYQVHCWDNKTPIAETLGTLDTLVKSGKVRYLGVSNHTGWQLQKTIDYAKYNGIEPYTCLQPQYNLLSRFAEEELIPVCMNEGLGVIPWAPLRGGWLSGRYRRGMTAPPANSRVEEAEAKNWGERWSAYDNEFTWNLIDHLFAVAEETGKTPAQVAIRWLIQKPGVTAPIIGARSMEQFEPNMGAVGWALSDEQMARLDKESTREFHYPYDFVAGGTRS